MLVYKHFKELGKYKVVDANGSVEEITKNFLSRLEEK